MVLFSCSYSFLTFSYIHGKEPEVKQHLDEIPIHWSIEPKEVIYQNDTLSVEYFKDMADRNSKPDIVSETQGLCCQRLKKVM